MSSKQQAFLGGTVVHKELRGFAAFVAYQGSHQSGGSVTKAMLEASIGQQYFGDAKNHDSIGLAEQFVRGMGIFGSLCENCSSNTGLFDSYLQTISILADYEAIASLYGGVML